MAAKIQPKNPLIEELERLRAENESLKARAGQSFRLTVSTKGALSMYGVRRFPITLYRDEWEYVLDRSDDVRAAIAEHSDSLKSKAVNRESK